MIKTKQTKKYFNKRRMKNFDLPKPRAATSVATNIFDFPERNSRKTKSRSDCDLSPCIAPHRTPKLRIKRTK